MCISLAIRTAAIAACIATGALAGLMPWRVMADAYPVGDKTTMWTDPYIIGSMRHLGEIYNSRKISRRDPVSELPRGEPVTDLEFDLAGQKRNLDTYFAESRTAGFIVLKNGRIVFEHYGVGDRKSTRLNSSHRL